MMRPSTVDARYSQTNVGLGSGLALHAGVATRWFPPLGCFEVQSRIFGAPHRRRNQI